MRLWRIHPKYLDCKGLLAVWREGLLAKNVLAGKTTGYRNHPQLEGFRDHRNPAVAINTYLSHIWNESRERCYNFDESKISKAFTCERIEVTGDQILSEFELLKKKLKKRDPEKHKELMMVKEPESNPLFVVR